MKLLTDQTIPQSERWSRVADTIHPDDNQARNRRFLVRSISKIIPSKYKAIFDAIALDKHYDAVVLTPSAGIRYAFVNSMLHRKPKPKTVLFEFWLHEDKGSIHAFKDFFRRIALQKVDLIITPSREEIVRYSLEYKIDKSKIIFIPFHTNEETLEFPVQYGDYVFSGGRSGRDFNTLIKAIEGTNIKLKLVVGKDEKLKEDIADNIEVFTEIDFRKYLELLKDARIVVVPLKPENRSSGQVVLLEAMGAAKPVVVTKTVGTEDYITDGHDGFFCSPHDVQNLRKLLLKLFYDIDLVKEIGRNARNTVEGKYLLENYVKQNLAAIRRLIEHRQGELM